MYTSVWFILMYADYVHKQISIDFQRILNWLNNLIICSENSGIQKVKQDGKPPKKVLKKKGKSCFSNLHSFFISYVYLIFCLLAKK